MGLGVNINGAKLRYLGASVDGAKPWVHFLKSFRQGHLRKSFEKRAKNKKDGFVVKVKANGVRVPFSVGVAVRSTHKQKAIYCT
jgi:hypothetical protein